MELPDMTLASRGRRYAPGSLATDAFEALSASVGEHDLEKAYAPSWQSSTLMATTIGTLAPGALSLAAGRGASSLAGD